MTAQAIILTPKQVEHYRSRHGNLDGWPLGLEVAEVIQQLTNSHEALREKLEKAETDLQVGGRLFAQLSGQFDDLSQELAEARAARDICGICWTTSWEPTLEGRQCGHCALIAAFQASQKANPNLPLIAPTEQGEHYANPY